MMEKLQGCTTNNKIWEEREDQIIRDNYGKLTYDEIANLLPGRTNQSIQHRRRKLGIETLHKELVTIEKWSLKQERALFDSLGKATIKEMCELTGRSFSSVSSKMDKLKKSGIIDINKFDRVRWSAEEDKLLIDNYSKDVNVLRELLPHRTKKSIHHRWRLLVPDDDKREQRTHEVNMNFFSVPDTNNCYWAGFHAADGCLTKNKHLLSIGLQQRDGYHLEQFAKDAGYSGTVYYNTTSEGYKKASLYIWGVKQWFADLKENFSLTPKKSLTLTPPLLHDEELVISFIRGLLDGDGSIEWVTRNKYGKDFWSVGVCGTYAMLEWVKSWFDEWSPISQTGRDLAQVCGPYKTKIYFYRVSGRRAGIILEKLLSVPTPFLKRKWLPVFDYFGIKPNNS